jgi:hypothetical protein
MVAHGTRAYIGASELRSPSGFHRTGVRPVVIIGASYRLPIKNLKLKTHESGYLITLFEILLQDAGEAARTLLPKCPVHDCGGFALALGIGVHTVAFAAYKALVARPLDAQDPSTLVNFKMRLHSGATNVRFSYPDYESYLPLDSFTGVIAFSIDQLRLAAEGSANWHRAEAESWLGRPGLLPATTKRSS